MIPLFKVFMSNDIDQALTKTLHSGCVTQGPKVEEFEHQLRSYFNHPFVVAVNSGTAGLTIAVRLLNLQSDDEILTTPLTCTATNFAILSSHTNLKWVDVDPQTCNMDLADLRRKITEKTKAVMVVHWGGNPIDLAELDDIKRYARQRFGTDLTVIEDCAHAMGAELGGKKIGTHGNICVFSFQAIKHLTTGDGGLITVPTEELYRRARRLRWFGIDRERRSKPGVDFRLEEDIPEWGYKFNMNDLSATIGLGNLPHLNSILEVSRRNAGIFEQGLRSTTGVILLNSIPTAVSARWIFTIKVVDKRGFMDFMTSKNVVVSQVHNRNDVHSCLSRYQTALPQLDSLVNEMISIPVGWWVSEEEAKYIVDCVNEWSGKSVSFRLIENTDADYLAYSNLITELNGMQIRDTTRDNYSCLVTTQTVYVLLSFGEIIGTGKVFNERKLFDEISHIEDIVIKSSHRGRGFGKELLRFLSMKGTGYKTVLNCTFELERFYRSCGYTSAGCQMVHRPS
jgi:dTDP-4-amino-4,6-dideoxygalactose transaminase/GNAT superfamily N-acetyltransferase